MTELVQVKYEEPIGKNSYYVFDPETGEEVLAGELKRRQAERSAAKNNNKNKNKKNNMANNGPPPENAAHPEQVVPDPKLPKGWKKIQLVKNPKVQWYVSNSGQEQWFRPGNLNSTTIILEDEEGLEPGWQRAYNSRNKAIPTAVWYEHEDGRTQWERPAANANKGNANKGNLNTGNVNTGNANTGKANKRNANNKNNFKNTTQRQNVSSGNALGNLKTQINKLGSTLNEMHSTLVKTQSAGRRKVRRNRRTRKSRK